MTETAYATRSSDAESASPYPDAITVEATVVEPTQVSGSESQAATGEKISRPLAIEAGAIVVKQVIVPVTEGLVDRSKDEARGWLTAKKQASQARKQSRRAKRDKSNLWDEAIVANKAHDKNKAKEKKQASRVLQGQMNEAAVMNRAFDKQKAKEQKDASKQKKAMDKLALETAHNRRIAERRQARVESFKKSSRKVGKFAMTTAGIGLLAAEKTAHFVQDAAFVGQMAGEAGLRIAKDVKEQTKVAAEPLARKARLNSRVGAEVARIGADRAATFSTEAAKEGKDKVVLSAKLARSNYHSRAASLRKANADRHARKAVVSTEKAQKHEKAV